MQILVLSCLLKKLGTSDKHMESKYNFNAYDSIIALILTQYLKERDYKAELGKVVEGKRINAPALAELLDRAAVWAKDKLISPTDPLTEGLNEGIRTALQDFSGEQYVHAMDTGFAEFLDDFLNDRA